MFNKPQFEPPTQSEIDDWEYRPASTGIAGETKLAIVVVTLLMVAFGFIVWQKLNPSSKLLMAKSDEQLQPFVFGQTPEQKPEIAPEQNAHVESAFQTVPENTPEDVQPTLAEANPFLFANSEATPAPASEPTTAPEQNPFAMNEPVPTVTQTPEPAGDFFATEDAQLPNPFAQAQSSVPVETEMPAQAPTLSFEEPVQVAATPEPEIEPATTLPEPIPLQLAQVEPEPSPFFRSVEKSAPPAQQAIEMPAHEEATDLLASVDPPQTQPQPESSTPFIPTQPVEIAEPVRSERFVASNQIEPAPFEPAPFQPQGEIQRIASKENPSEPTLKEPVPLQLQPIELPTETTIEPAPGFAPMLIPKDSQQGQLKSNASEQTPLPSFGDFKEESNQLAPMTIQPAERHQDSLGTTHTAAPTFTPSHLRPLNPGTGQRVTADNSLPVITPAPRTITESTATESTANEQIYEVVEGDNYWSISQKNYGKARYFSALAEYNRGRIPRPERMKAGMKVLIPDEKVLQQQYPRLVGMQVVDENTVQVSNDTGEPGFFVDSSGQPYYRIGKGDTLTDVALKHLGRTSRWVQIFGMNQDVMPDANILKIGTVLRLPRDASQVARAPE